MGNSVTCTCIINSEQLQRFMPYKKWLVSGKKILNTLYQSGGGGGDDDDDTYSMEQSPS